MPNLTSSVFEEHLKISNHYRQLTRTIYDFARAGEFCDLRLNTKTREFFAHKVVLAACSPFFLKAFSNGALNEGVIEMSDIDDETIETILKFIYSGEGTVTDQTIWNVLEASYMYEVQGVIDLCVELVLMRNLDSVRALIIGHSYLDSQLKEYALAAITSNFKGKEYLANLIWR